MRVQLAAASLDDLPALRQWMQQLRTADPMASAAFVPAGDSELALTNLLRDPNLGRLWIILADDQPVGYVAMVFSFSIELGGRAAFIDEVFVEPSMQRKGIGRQVVSLVTVESRRLNLRNLFLEVSESNLPARRLYETCGFTPRPYGLMSRWLGNVADDITP